MLVLWETMPSNATFFPDLSRAFCGHYRASHCTAGCRSTGWMFPGSRSSQQSTLSGALSTTSLHLSRAIICKRRQQPMMGVTTKCVMPIRPTLFIRLLVHTATVTIMSRHGGCQCRATIVLPPKDLEPLLFFIDKHFQYMPLIPQFVICRYAFCFLVIESLFVV
jgi:hypothetical protein